MGVLGLFFIPAIVVYGYYARSIRAAADGDQSPPPFDQWMDLIHVGASTLVVVAGWILATVWIFAVVSIPLAGTSVQYPFTLVAAVVYLYILPAPLALYAVTGDVRSTFSRRNLAAVYSSVAYVRAVGGSLVAATIAYVPVGVAAAVALVVGVSEIVYALMFMVLPFATFWFQLVTAYLYGQAVAAVGVEPSAEN